MQRSMLVTAGLCLAVATAHAASVSRVVDLDDATLIAELQAALNGEAVEGAGPCLFPHVASLEIRGLPVAALGRQTTNDIEYNYETPEGHFEILYFRTGVAAVDTTDTDDDGTPDYVEWVAEAMEESYQREVVELGFPFATGGRYTVRLASLGPGFYGVTRPNEAAFGRSTISINADFATFFSTPPFDQLTNDDPDGDVRGAIRVTAAHEFKHTLQVYNRWLIDNQYLGWFEVDATWIEDIVYDGVNDYYNYVDDFTSPFTSPRVSLIGNASYDDATWQHFLQQRHGIDFMKRLDTRRANLTDEPFQNSYRGIATELDIDWRELWREYGLATYLSGDRAVDGLGFEEAARYPTASTDAVASLEMTSPLEQTLPRWANAFLQYDNSGDTAQGQLSVTFRSDTVGEFALTVVMQSDLRTEVVPLIQETAEQTFVVEGLDVAFFDRIALLVGNSQTSSAAIPDPFEVTFTLDPTVTSPPTSFGRLKSRF